MGTRTHTTALAARSRVLAVLVAVVVAVSACSASADDDTLTAGTAVTLAFEDTTTTVNVSLEQLVNAYALHTYIFDAQGALQAVDGIIVSLTPTTPGAPVMELRPVSAGPGHHITPIPMADLTTEDDWTLDVTVISDDNTELFASTDISFDIES